MVFFFSWHTKGKVGISPSTGVALMRSHLAYAMHAMRIVQDRKASIPFERYKASSYVFQRRFVRRENQSSSQISFRVLLRASFGCNYTLNRLIR